MFALWMVLLAAACPALTRKTKLRLLLLLLVLGVSACHAREKPDAPKPKAAAHTFMAGKAFWALTSLHSGSALYDGITTKQSLDRCAACDEGDMFSRSFIGRRPGWGSMAPWGGAEVIGTALLAARMRRSHVRIIQKFWWAPQLAFSVLHLRAGTQNIFVCPSGCKN